jgi:hypothetical protein
VNGDRMLKNGCLISFKHPRSSREQKYGLRCCQTRTTNAEQIMSHVHCGDHVDRMPVVKLMGTERNTAILPSLNAS